MTNTPPPADDPEADNAANQKTEAASDGESCSLLESLAIMLEMPVEDVREAARNIARERAKKMPSALMETLKIIHSGITASDPGGFSEPCPECEGLGEIPRNVKTNHKDGAGCISRLVRPLPISGEADCPQCISTKSVCRHNADWTCRNCGYHEIVDDDHDQTTDRVGLGESTCSAAGVWYPGPESGGGGTAGPCTEDYPSGAWWDGDHLLVAVNVINNQTGMEWTEYHAVIINCDEESFSVEESGTGEDIGWGPESWAWWMRIPSPPNAPTTRAPD